MTKYLFIGLFVLPLVASSQALRDINFDYIYNPGAPLSFDMKPVRANDRFLILYELAVADTTSFEDRYDIVWEGRQLHSDREANAVTFEQQQLERTSGRLQGVLSISITEAPRYLVARVTDKKLNRAWLFFTTLDKEYPVNNYLVSRGAPVTNRYIRPDDRLTFGIDSGQWTVFYYNDDFPAAAPAFSEAQAPVSPVLSADSIFVVDGSSTLQFSAPGLYLIQRDTAEVEGFAFRVEDDYPQYKKLVNLAGPLVYITTRNEHERLTGSRGNKKTFDRVVLGITQNTERARILMRNYFRRVELANRYFSSYKEGWKTDRGMVLIIFGLPDAVYQLDDREIWEYKNNRVDDRFTFVRSGSIFDPDNFVLIRQKKRERLWYEIVDLWRNARF